MRIRNLVAHATVILLLAHAMEAKHNPEMEANNRRHVRAHMLARRKHHTAPQHHLHDEPIERKSGAPAGTSTSSNNAPMMSSGSYQSVALNGAFLVDDSTLQCGGTGVTPMSGICYSAAVGPSGENWGRQIYGLVFQVRAEHSCDLCHEHVKEQHQYLL